MSTGGLYGREGGRGGEDEGVNRLASHRNSLVEDRGAGSRRGRAAMSSSPLNSATASATDSYATSFERRRSFEAAGPSTAEDRPRRRSSASSIGSQPGGRAARLSYTSGGVGRGRAPSATSPTNAQEDPRLLCVLDVAYAKDKSDRISIPFRADASILAAEFAAKHGLEASQVRTLEDFIQRTIAEHMAARAEVVMEEEEEGDNDFDMVEEREEEEARRGAGDDGQGDYEIGGEDEEEEEGDGGVLRYDDEAEEGGGSADDRGRGSYLEQHQEGGYHYDSDYAEDEGRHGILPTSSSRGDRRASRGSDKGPGFQSPPPLDVPSQHQHQHPLGQQHHRHSTSSSRLKELAGGNKRHRQGAPSTSSYSDAEERKDWMSPPLDRPDMEVTTEEDEDGAGGATSSSSNPPSSSPSHSSSAVEGEALFNKLKQAWRSASTKGTPEFGKVPSEAAAQIRSFTPDPRHKRGGAGGGSSGRLAAAGKKGSAFARLYEEAEVMKKRQQDARDRKAKLEEKEMKERQWTVPPKTRQIIDQYLAGQRAEMGDVGSRLYEQAMKCLKDRANVSEKAKKTAEEKIDDWVCPKCFHVNNWEEEECQRVVGRTRALVDEIPSAWVYVSEGTIMGNRGGGGGHRGGTAEVIRCHQPRPASLYNPTIVSLQDYQNVYMAALPVSVRYRPENIHEDLFARRAQIEQRRRTLCCQRWDEEKTDCTFRPEINEHSKVLIDERDRQLAEAEAAGVLEEVTMEKAVRRQRLHAGCVAEELFSYKPDIGVNHYTERVETHQQFVNRLAVEDPQRRSEKVQTISKYVFKLEGTYRPTINLRPTEPRLLNGKLVSVSDYLYEYRHTLRHKKEEQDRKVTSDIHAKANMRYTKDLSRKLVQDMKGKAYESIFRNLFPDPSEATIQSVLSVSEASMAGITSRQLAESLSAVLTSSARGSGRLTFPEFCARLDAHVVSLGDLLHHPCTMAAEEKSSYALDKNKELTFHPVINRLSAHKAQERWASPETMYEVLHREREAIMTKRQERKKVKDELEFKSCTFKPELQAYKYGEPRYHFPNLAWLTDEERRDREEQKNQQQQGKGSKAVKKVFRAGRLDELSPPPPPPPPPSSSTSSSPLPRRRPPPLTGSSLNPATASSSGSYRQQAADALASRSPKGGGGGGTGVKARRNSYLKGYLAEAAGGGGSSTTITTAVAQGDVFGGMDAAALEEAPPPPPPPLPPHLEDGAMLDAAPEGQRITSTAAKRGSIDAGRGGADYVR